MLGSRHEGRNLRPVGIEETILDVEHPRSDKLSGEGMVAPATPASYLATIASRLHLSEKTFLILAGVVILVLAGTTVAIASTAAMMSDSTATIHEDPQRPDAGAISKPVPSPTPTPTEKPGFTATSATITSIASSGPHAVAETTNDYASSRVYNSMSSTPIEVTHPPLSGTQQITRNLVGVQQVTTADPGFAVLYSITTPAAGLVTETVACELDVYSSAGALRSTIPLSTCYSGIRLAGDVVLLNRNEEPNNDGNKVNSVTAMDAKSGSVLWKTQSGGHNVPVAAMTCGGGIGGALLGDMEVTDVGTVIFTGNGELVSYDYKTGVKVWGAVMNRCYEGAFVNTGFDGIGLISYNGDTYFDTHTGKELVPNETSGAVDPTNGLISVSYLKSDYGSTDTVNGNPSAFETTDPSTGSVVFSLPRAAGVALGTLKALAAYDGRVWIWTASGLDIISAKTGQQDPAAPPHQKGIQFAHNIPLSAGASWVVLTDTNGYGELGKPATLVWSSRPLSFADLPATLVSSF